MIFEPRDVLRKTEFDKILDLLEKETLTPMASEVLQALQPSVSFPEIDT